VLNVVGHHWAGLAQSSCRVVTGIAHELVMRVVVDVTPQVTSLGDVCHRDGGSAIPQSPVALLVVVWAVDVVIACLDIAHDADGPGIIVPVPAPHEVRIAVASHLGPAHVPTTAAGAGATYSKTCWTCPSRSLLSSVAATIGGGRGKYLALTF